MQRFLDAALDLMNTSSDKEFTVQEVVERSGQSLRSFYQYFAGKHELLLALFEESVRATADHLRELTAAEADPIDRLHVFVIEHYRLCRPTPARAKSAKKTTSVVPSPAMGEFAQQVLTANPNEASRAFAPVVSLFEELLAAAAAAGHIRSELNHRRVAGIILQSIMFNAFSATISGTSIRAADDGAEELWGIVLRGITTGSAG